MENPRSRRLKKGFKMLNIDPVVAVLALCALVITFLLGPRPDGSCEITFQDKDIGDNVVDYLSRKESAYSDIRDGLAKQIIWNAPDQQTKTNFVVVYIHGYSASKVELSPLPQNIAKSLGANLYFTRLPGHGRSGDAMAEPQMSDWINDVVEAVAVGEKLGDKIILLTASTGGTLASWIAGQAEYRNKISALVLVSPNFAIQAASTRVLNMPWAKIILPLLIGPTRSFEPQNEQHRDGWTYQYPSKAILPLAALLKTVERIDKSTITTPALFIYSSQDKTVSPTKTLEVIKAWGGPTHSLLIEDSDDPKHHVVTGDILSPNTTQAVSDSVLNWIEAASTNM